MVDAATQEPLIGATILVKGTSNGTATGIDGDFSLKVEVGSTLQVSYVGYTTADFKVPSDGQMNISLSENSSVLNEVVVVGAVMKKADLTGSVGYLDAEKLNETPSTTVAGALQGKMAGLMVTPSGKPGEDATVRVRGINTISANWAVTNEKFMEDQHVFDNLKLRVGYGVVGNQDIENYAYATMYYSTVSNGSASYATSGLLGNPLLTWEKQKQTNRYRPWIIYV